MGELETFYTNLSGLVNELRLVAEQYKKLLKVKTDLVEKELRR